MADNFSKKLSKFGHNVLQKTQNAADTVSLQGELQTYQEQLAQVFCEVGKQYHAAHATEPSNEFPTLCGQADELTVKIAALQERIAQLKGQKTCPACNARVAYQAAFCPLCGAALGDLPKEQQPALRTGICAACGAKIEEEAMFCPNCGKKQL